MMTTQNAAKLSGAGKPLVHATARKASRARTFYEGAWWLYVAGIPVATRAVCTLKEPMKALFHGWLKGQIYCGWQVFVEHLDAHRALPHKSAPKSKPYSLLGHASGRELYEFLVLLEREITLARVRIDD